MTKNETQFFPQAGDSGLFVKLTAIPYSVASPNIPQKLILKVCSPVGQRRNTISDLQAAGNRYFYSKSAVRRMQMLSLSNLN